MIEAIHFVNKFYKTEIRQKTRQRDVCFPRQVYIYAVHQTKTLSLSEIAKTVNLTNHATILHAVKTVKGLCEVDKTVKKEVDEVVAGVKKIVSIKENGLTNYEDKKMVAYWIHETCFSINFNNPFWEDEPLPSGLKNGDLIKLMLNFKLWA